MCKIIYAADLSADLGYGRKMPPAFWRWCKSRGLTGASDRPFAFDANDVAKALQITVAA